MGRHAADSTIRGTGVLTYLTAVFVVILNDLTCLGDDDQYNRDNSSSSASSPMDEATHAI